MALYMISFTSQGIVIAFFAALFPQLARNTSHSRELRKRREQGELSPEAYENEKAIEMSKISSVSMVRLRIWCPIVEGNFIQNLVDLSFHWQYRCLVTQFSTTPSPESQSES
jgi:hypothetical protein